RHGDARAVKAALQAPRLEGLLDLARAFGEELQMLGLEARDTHRAVPPGPAVAVGLDLVAEAAQRLRQLGLVDLSAESLRTEDLSCVHRPPFTVRTPRHVQDDAVRVKLRVQGSARLVPEACGHDDARRFHRTAAVHPRLGVPLELGQGLAHRAVVGLEEPLVTGDERSQAYALVRGNRHVPASTPLAQALAVWHQYVLPIGVMAFQQVRE